MALKRKIIYLFFIAVVSIVLSVSCANGINDSNLTQTGLLDQGGNIITNTLVKTNTLRFEGNIPSWATNINVSYIITTNDGYFDVEYGEEVTAPNLPGNPTDYYKIFVPYTGKEFYTVSYKDTNMLNQLWLDQVFRRGASDGKVFAIRNRANDRDMNNFQKEINGRKDYYYFKDNGDIVYKGGDKTDLTKETLMKRFIGAVIVDYRTVEERTKPEIGRYRADKINKTGEYTVGAVYKMAINVNEARRIFADGGGGPTDGAYEFIAARKKIWFSVKNFHEDTSIFLRQYYNTNFIEVLVLNYHANEGHTRCLGVDAYYAYYGSYRAGENAMPVEGFTAENMPYMTDERIYLGQRPEYIVPVLNHTTTFTDASRWWSFLALPGEKY